MLHRPVKCAATSVVRAATSGDSGAELPQRFLIVSRWAETLSHPSAEEIRSCGSDAGSVHSDVCFLHRHRLSVCPPCPGRTSEEHVVHSVRLYRFTATWPVDQRGQICCLFYFMVNSYYYLCVKHEGRIWISQILTISPKDCTLQIGISSMMQDFSGKKPPKINSNYFSKHYRFISYFASFWND